MKSIGGGGYCDVTAVIDNGRVGRAGTSSCGLPMYERLFRIRHSMLILTFQDLGSIKFGGCLGDAYTGVLLFFHLHIYSIS